MKKPSYQSRDEQFIQRLRQLVIANLKNEQFGVVQLSADIGLSRSQLYRKLKQIRGQTISQFVREVRLQEALRLLESDISTAAEIAYAVGFGSPAYFHKCFIEHFGITPGAVRKRLRAGQDSGAILSASDRRNALASDGALPSGTALLPNWMKRTIWLLFALMLVLLAISFFPNAAFPEGEAPPTIAILPVNYLEEADEADQLALELYEGLKMEVGHTEALRVLSRTSTQSFTRRNMLLSEVAEELSVDAVVESSLLITEDSIAIKLHLIRVFPVEYQWWAKEYRLTRANALSFLDPIVWEVAGEIRRELISEQ